MLLSPPPCLLFTLFFILTFNSIKCSNEKIVKSKLTTNWLASPIILETSEFIYKYHPKIYWELIDEISTKLDGIKICHMDEYTLIVDIISKYLTPTLLDYFNVVIARHDFAPRIQLYQKILDDFKVDPNCESIFFVGNNHACEFNQAVSLIGNYKGNDIFQTIFDNYPKFKNDPSNKRSIIYYFGQIGTTNFWSNYNKLKEFVNKSSNVDFILVPYSKNKCSIKVGLSNYGMGLTIKRNKYDLARDNLIDLIQYKNNSIFSKWLGLDMEGVTLNKSNIDPGLNMETLIETYPADFEELTQLKKQIYDENKKNTLYRMSLKELHKFALFFISYAKEVATLNELTELMSTLPSHLEEIVNKKFPKSFKQESKKFLEFLSTFGMNTGVYLNGQELGNLVEKNFEQNLMLETTISSMLSDYIKNTSLNDITTKDWNQLLESHSKNLFVSKRLTIQDSTVTWLNDLENDPIYSHWPHNIVFLFQLSSMQQLPTVALNAYNLVCFIDPMDTNTKTLLMTILKLFTNQFSIRFGLVINGKKNCKLSKLMTSGFYFLAAKNPRQATRFLIDVLGSRNNLNVNVIKNTFNKYSKLDLININGQNEDVNDRISEIRTDIQDIGLKLGKSYYFLNGKMFDLIKDAGSPPQGIMREAFKECFHLYDKFTLRQFKTVSQLINYNEEFVDRFNENLIDSPAFLNLNAAEFLVDKTYMDKWVELIEPKTIFFHANYESSDNSENQRSGLVLIFADLDSYQGRHLVKTIVTHKSKVASEAKYTFIFSEKNPKLELTEKLRQLLGTSQKEITEEIDSLFDYYEIDSIESTINLSFYQKLNLEPSDNAVVWNNKIFKLTDATDFVGGDVELVLEMSLVPISVFKNRDNENMKPIYRETFLHWFTILVGNFPAVPRLLSKLDKIVSNFDTFVVTYDVREGAKDRFLSSIAPHMVLFIDPLADNSPRIFNQLNAIYNSFAVKVTLIMAPTLKLEKLPIHGYFHWCYPSSPSFDGISGYMLNPSISFKNLPLDPVYTSSMDLPPSWMIQNVNGDCDMDNIYLKMTLEGCNASYALKYILIEGTSWYEKHTKPSSGTQYVLKDINNHPYSDTLVMNNLGYFQLKSDVGIYRIVPKRTATNKFVIDTMTTDSKSVNYVVMDAFDGINLEILGAEKKEDEEEEDEESNEEDNDEDEVGFFERITSIFHSNKRKNKNETINIFSVATGSIYERFTRVMMLSVMKTTKKPVKFWLLRNYLSANFIDSLEILAKKYNFEYDFVQYQWPKWLNDQKEKRRTIWGYKILFLDVLFPLNVKRIIFVDADQVVRADLDELNKMNIGRAPYAYTPFCNDRHETDSYRFWTGGYWKRLLNGKPYHISALYVVDLQTFRNLAVGDRLRASYQTLSEDPNSLQNLDQDLPNSMIHEIPIKSLPQEWLWCETWCSDAIKKYAKSIDLCTNPLTEEPKWTSALRIIPEFADYDTEIETLLHPSLYKSVSKNNATHATNKTLPNIEL